MKLFSSLSAVLVVCALLALSACADSSSPAGTGTTDTGTNTGTDTTTTSPTALTNQFVSKGGYAESDVTTKLNTIIGRFFGTTTSESTTPAVDGTSTSNSGLYRCYYELPQDSSMAFIYAADSCDIRSEGQSYGMMIAVQMDMQTQFDRLWKFAKTYMQYTSSTGTYASWQYYFKWQGTVAITASSSWTVTFSDGTSPASDGDEYFVMALYLADKRWGSTGTFDYKTEADNIANAMLHNTSGTTYKKLFNTATGVSAAPTQVTFCPIGGAADYTDPSYHLPAFYQLLASYGPSADSATWAKIAGYSRAFLVSSANSTTGLHPDYATFSGAPTTSSSGSTAASTAGLSGTDHDTFRYDAWRVVMNMALDAAWWGTSSMTTQVAKYHSFFSSYHGTNNVANSLWPLDGTTGSGSGSTALTATLAAGSQVSTNTTESTFWVQSLYNVSQQKGLYRYYQECVYILGFLVTSGNFKASW